MAKSIRWNGIHKLLIEMLKIRLRSILSYFTSKITIFVKLMYRGSTLLYTQKVLVYTKSITRIKTKGGAIIR